MKNSTNNQPPFGSNPEDQLKQMIFGKIKTQLLYVAAELGIADLLSEGPKSVQELSNSTGTHAPSLFRVMRALASQGIFAETEPGLFSITELAEGLKKNVSGSLRDLAVFFGSDWHNKAWSNLLHSVKTGESAFENVFEMNLYEYMEKHADKFAAFNEAMTAISHREADCISKAYDFSNFNTLVDIGGGQGRLLITILKAFPSLKGILFDLPSVFEGGTSLITKEGLEDRCQVVGGSFFESIPRGGDAYIFKNVIHNWDDERAMQILLNCRKAIPSEGRILVAEMIIPSDNSPFFGKIMDIEMLVIPGGVERTENEFRELFARANFNLKQIIPTGLPHSILEGIPV